MSNKKIIELSTNIKKTTHLIETIFK